MNVQTLSTKYWSMVVFCPNEREKETLIRRMKRLSYGIYGVNTQANGMTHWTCFFRFKHKVRMEEAQHMLSAGFVYPTENTLAEIRKIKDLPLHEEYGSIDDLNSVCYNLDIVFQHEGNTL